MDEWELKYRQLKARHDDLREVFTDAMRYMVEFAEGMRKQLENVEALIVEEEEEKI